jgi:isopenicillin N synthase-like dioxygenase
VPFAPPVLTGCWSRSLLVRADGSRDTTTQVTWLQAGSAYVDLRQPADLPQLAGRPLAELDRSSLQALAIQEAFAGTTSQDGPVCTWTRDIDLSPLQGSADVGTVRLDGDVLVEEGVHEPYVEHWHLTEPVAPYVAVMLRDPATGEPALLLRTGNRFGWARGRRAPLATGTLGALVASAATDDDARALLDVEVSLGRVGCDGWPVERSSLPDRVGQDVRLVLEGDTATTGDGRVWAVEQVDGDRALLARTFTEIPVVDVSGLLHGDAAQQRAVAAELGRAAREVGFLYITGTDVDQALYDGLLRATKEFFTQPTEAKMAVYIGRSRNHRGYVPPGEEVLGGQTRDLKEAYDLALDLPADDPDWLAGNPLLGPNAWPALPGFAEAVTPYYDAVMALGRALLRGFAMALGEDPTFFDGFVRKPPSQLRLIHYPHDANAEDVVGLGAHTDYECFTLLRSTSPGLEVLNGEGTWIDAPPRAGAFVLNIGDLLETWTNGQFVATSHRVRKVTEERWSFPLFFNVDYDTVVAALPQFVRDGDTPRRPLVAGEHLFAQTAQTFGYLKRRLEAGELSLAEDALGLSSFGQVARQAVAP